MLEEIIRRFEGLRDKMAAGELETIDVSLNIKEIKSVIFYLNHLKDKIAKEQKKKK